MLMKKLESFLRFPSAIPRLFGGLNEAGNFVSHSMSETYEKCAKSSISIKFTHGFRIMLNPHDTTISPWIHTMGVYDFESTALFSRIIEPNGTVIDVGANIGWFTLLAAEILKQNGRVFSFEPEATNFSLLSASVSMNHFTNVVMIKKCVSDTNEDQLLSLSPESNPGAHSIVRDLGGTKTVVQSVCLDTFANANNIGNIDLLKVDVEGAEPKVLLVALESDK